MMENRYSSSAAVLSWRRRMENDIVAVQQGRWLEGSIARVIANSKKEWKLVERSDTPWAEGLANSDI